MKFNKPFVTMGYFTKRQKHIKKAYLKWKQIEKPNQTLVEIKINRSNRVAHGKDLQER